MREVIRWGIIGCGDVCEVKSGPGFQKASGSALVAVMRRDGAKAADFAKRHGVPRCYDDAADLIRDPEVDAIYIATPPGAHLEHALAVAAAGKPCYVEKPMALNHEDCTVMNDAFARAGLPLFVAYYRRCLPRFQRVGQLLDDEAIGRLTTVLVRHLRRPTAKSGWRFDPEAAGGGLFVDVGSHTLDLLDHWLGPLEVVAGGASRFGEGRVEDVVNASFRTSSGAVGVGVWSFVADRDEECVELIGSQGRIHVSVFGADPVQLHTHGGVQTFAEPAPPHVQQPLIQTIVDQLRGRGACPSTGESGARTTRVVDTVLEGFRRSMSTGGQR
jgi:predicted dehydrogenase